MYILLGAVVKSCACIAYECIHTFGIEIYFACLRTISFRCCVGMQFHCLSVIRQESGKKNNKFTGLENYIGNICMSYFRSACYNLFWNKKIIV